MSDNLNTLKKDLSEVFVEALKEERSPLSLVDYLQSEYNFTTIDPWFYVKSVSTKAYVKVKYSILKSKDLEPDCSKNSLILCYDRVAFKVSTALGDQNLIEHSGWSNFFNMLNKCFERALKPTYDELITPDERLVLELKIYDSISTANVFTLVSTAIIKTIDQAVLLVQNVNVHLKDHIEVTNLPIFVYNLILRSNISHIPHLVVHPEQEDLKKGVKLGVCTFFLTPTRDIGESRIDYFNYEVIRQKNSENTHSVAETLALIKELIIGR